MSVAASIVRKVVADRLVPTSPDHVKDCAEENDADPDDALAFEASDRVLARSAADRLWADLDERDRRLIAHVKMSARRVESLQILQLKKSAIEARQKRLLATMAAALDQIADVGTAWDRLLELHELHLAGHATGSAP